MRLNTRFWSWTLATTATLLLLLTALFVTSAFDRPATLADFSVPLVLAKRDVLLIALAVVLLQLLLRALLSRLAIPAPAGDASQAPGDAQATWQSALGERTAEHELALKKLARLVENGLLLARERDRPKLLRHILFGSRDIAHCAACTLFLKTDRSSRLPSWPGCGK